MQKQIILEYLIDYLKLKNVSIKKSGKITMLKCVVCNKEPMSANLIPHTSIINCFSCQKKYNLLDVAKKIETNFPSVEKEQLHYLKELLNIKVTTTIDEENTDELMNFYKENNFDLTPIAKDSKIPIEKLWTTRKHKDIEEWKRWIVIDELNIGVKTGISSNISVIDLDILNKEEKDEYRFKNITQLRKQELEDKRDKGLKIIYDKLGNMLGQPLIQENLGGEHLIYQYEEELQKTSINFENIHIDIENNGGYILIEPSKLGITTRKFKELKSIPKMQEELKKFLLSKTKSPKKTYSEEIREDIKTEDFKLEIPYKNLEGCCNVSFIKLGGILRKQLNGQQTGYVLYTLNKHLLENPMPTQDVTAMIGELDKYCEFDEEDLASKIIEYLKDVEEANRTEIAMALMGTNRGENKKRIDKALAYLVKEDKLVKRGTKYELIKEMNWRDDLLNIGVPVNFVVPYLHNFAYLNQEDLIVIGSQNKYGKTTLAMNVVKRLVDQGIKPDYIYNETGGRYAKVALKLGMKNSDFYAAFCADPDKIILRKNKIVIFDWVKPKDFARTDNVFADLVEKIKKTHGFMICFVQLRNNDGFFAPDQIGQFPALVVKYVHNNEEGTDTKFIAEYVRESKIKAKKFEIPCVYDWETHQVKTAYEIEKEQKLEN